MRTVVSVASSVRGDRGPTAAPQDTAADARALIGRHLAYRCPKSLIDDAALVATELLSNVVRYGTPPWDVTMWLVREQGGRRYVRLEAADAGAGIDAERVRARWRHPSQALTSGGRGLFIVDTLASSWGDDRGDHGHTLWAELEIPPDDRASGRSDAWRPGGPKRPR